MAKFNYLNVGCGEKYHKDWVNIDQYSDNPNVYACNLLKGIPFSDNMFEAVYLSEVLEHFTKKDAAALIRELYRVLKTNGIIRIVVPNLEDIAKTYLEFLNKNLSNPTEESMANYDWILLEMYDQVARNASGGEMAEFLRKPVIVNEQFVLDRIGYVGKNIRDCYLQEQKATKNWQTKFRMPEGLNPKNWRKLLNLNYLRLKIVGLIAKLFRESKHLHVGRFRSGGENHYWMYDRYSLSRLLKECGFKEIKVKTPLDSDIPEWGKYELDIKNGQIYDPKSLFMEAKK